jgi:hypothetical protein
MTSIFNPNIPQTNDDPTVSQSQLLGNFGKLNSDWAANHVPLTSGGNNGFHKFIQFPTVLSGDPTLTGLQSQVYPKTDGNGNTALFFANASKVYQLNDLTIVNPGAGGANDYGFVTPFGFTINAGSVASGVTTVTFAVPFTTGKVYALELTPQLGSAVRFAINSLTMSGPSVTGFKINTSSSAAYYYLAIGV